MASVDVAAIGGLLIGVEGTAKGTATFIACGTKFTLISGKRVNVKGCGSLIMEVVVGPVDVLNSSEDTVVSFSTGTPVTVTETTTTGKLTLQLDESTTVSVPSGSTATITEFSEGEFQIVNDSPESTPPINIQIDGSNVQVGPGQDFLPIAIDIKPGSDPNAVNLGSDGVIAVAILTTSMVAGNSVDFDVTAVDQSTLTLAGVSARVKGKSGNIGSLGYLTPETFRQQHELSLSVV